MAVRLHVQGHPSRLLELPSFSSAELTERVKMVRTITMAVYHLLLVYGGDTIGLSGMSSRDSKAVIQNLRNDLKKTGVGPVLEQLVTGGRPLKIEEVSLLARAADGLGRWAQATTRGLRHFKPDGSGLFIGLDVGVEKIKTHIVRDGKILFKGMFPAGCDQSGEAVTHPDQQCLGRGIDGAVSKTYEIGTRSGAGTGSKALDGLVIAISRQAAGELMPEPKWILSALHNKFSCPIWVHSDREAQAFASAVIFGCGDVCAVSLGMGYSAGLLRGGLPLDGPIGAEFFWEDRSRDCYKGASLAFLSGRAELAEAARLGFKSALDRLDIAEINQAAASKSHPMHYRAYEVVRYLGKHLAWNLAELHSIVPFELATISGWRSSQIGGALADEVKKVLERSGVSGFDVLPVESKTNPALTGAYGAALLASAHRQGIAVGGIDMKLLGVAS